MRQHPVVADTLQNDGDATRMEFGSITETRQIKQNTVPGQVDPKGAGTEDRAEGNRARNIAMPDSSRTMRRKKRPSQLLRDGVSRNGGLVDGRLGNNAGTPSPVQGCSVT
jgi:hypothetical protein